MLSGAYRYVCMGILPMRVIGYLLCGTFIKPYLWISGISFPNQNSSRRLPRPVE